ncbi:MAG: hypothetical protein JNM89_10660 [Hyphomicrobiaceae bacterium]|nr:hypothetical protein [Hyphomicrobiaceae bacterium]
MKGKMLVALLAACAAVVSVSAPVEAGERGWRGHHKSYSHRRGPQVRGYVARRGGYSYSYAESVNTYGDSFARYGAGNSLRDPSMENQQTIAGPFDNGFFFDSGSSARGGDAPYMN